LLSEINCGVENRSLEVKIFLVGFVKIEKMNSQAAQNFAMNFVQFFVAVLIDRKQKNQ